jgi:hypothetical protein
VGLPAVCPLVLQPMAARTNKALEAVITTLRARAQEALLTMKTPIRPLTRRPRSEQYPEAGTT